MKLMIVAHPDDESLFGGGRLLKSKWKVVCITNGNNPIRRNEFEQVMRITNSDYEIWNYPDKRKPFSENSLIIDIKRVIEGFDEILTHGELGEYGHIHHIQLHKLLKQIVKCSFFDLNGPPLPEDTWQAKLDLISVYQSQKDICSRLKPIIRNERLD